MNSGNLEVTTPTDREIVIKRVFDAPRHLVFQAFSQPEFLKRWLLGPPGWSMIVCETANKVGDKYRYVWRHANGEEMGMGGVCREFVPPERLVVTETFDQPWYEGEALVTTALADEAGTTILTLTILYSSRKTRDAVLKSGMQTGLAASYDRLADVLGSQALMQHS